MPKFTLIKSPDEIINALNGNGYSVSLSPNYVTKKGEFKPPKVANMNKDGLSLEYINEKYPDKKYILFVENEFEIESHNVFNVRLIKYMFKTYGNEYLTHVKMHVLQAINATCSNERTAYRDRRLKDDMEFYNQLYAEVKAEIEKEAKLKKSEIEAGGGVKPEQQEEAE